jgi:hypothetical protein
MIEVPIQVSKKILRGLNPKGKYLVQAQKGGCSVHIYNPILAKRPDMHPLDVSTGRPKMIIAPHSDVITECITLKDKPFHVDPSLKAVLDEIAEEHEINQSRIRLLEEERVALLNDKSTLNYKVKELTSKERLLQDIIVSLKDEIASIEPEETDTVASDGMTNPILPRRKKSLIALKK